MHAGKIIELMTWTDGWDAAPGSKLGFTHQYPDRGVVYPDGISLHWISRSRCSIPMGYISMNMNQLLLAGWGMCSDYQIHSDLLSLTSPQDASWAEHCSSAPLYYYTSIHVRIVAPLKSPKNHIVWLESLWKKLHFALCFMKLHWVINEIFRILWVKVMGLNS
jgi:hypothetical protein